MTVVNGTLPDSVKEYYGKVLQGNKDLKTTACCSTDSAPAHQKDILELIEDEILDRFYGCGSPIPDELDGKTVLDLGCGTGRDSYLVSKLVGPSGHVTGVDMTDEQLNVANRNLDQQMENFGFDKPNIEFKKGYIENLKELGIEDNSVDVVISNLSLIHISEPTRPY